MEKIHEEHKSCRPWNLVNAKYKNGMYESYIPFLLTLTHWIVLRRRCCRCRFCRNGFCRRGLLRILPIVAFDTSRGVDQLLLARVIRMTIRANFKMDIADRRTSLERITANTGHNCALVFGVNSFFHYFLQNPKIKLRQYKKRSDEVQEQRVLKFESYKILRIG